MEIVHYEDYSGRERQTTRYFHDEKQREELPLIAKIGVGLAVGAGILSVGHRSGAIRKIAQFIDTEGKSTLRAFREAMDQQGKALSGSERITSARLKKLSRFFVERRRSHLGNLRTSPQNVLLRREMDMERYIRQRKRLIGEVKAPGQYTGDVPFHIQEGFRFGAVMEHIREKGRLTEGAVKELEKALSKGRVNILNHGTDDELRELLRVHGKGIDHKEALEALKEARNKFKDKDFIAENDEAMQFVLGIQKKLREFTAHQMQDITKRDKLLKRARIGHKQATVGDILSLNEANKIRINPDLKMHLNEIISYNKKFKEAVFDENLYLSAKNGELIDYKVFSDLRRRTADWMSGTLPGGLLHLRDILNVKEAREQASFRIFKRGTVQSSLNAHRGFENTEGLNEDVIFVNGKFVKLFDYNALKNNESALTVLNPDRDMFLTSSQFGSIGKMHRHMSGMMTNNEKKRNFISRVLDIGNQEKDSLFTQVSSVFMKFFRPDWQRNQVESFLKEGISSSTEYKDILNYFKYNTKGLTPRTLNHLNLPDKIKQVIDREKISFSSDEDIIKLFTHIGKAETRHSGKINFESNWNPTGQRVNTPHTELFSLYKQFERDPDSVLNMKTPIGESSIFFGNYTNVYTGIDTIRQQVSLYLTQEALLDRARKTITGTTLDAASEFRKELRDLYSEGRILKSDLQEAENMLNYSMLQSQSFDLRKNRDQALDRVSDMLKGNIEFQESLKKMVRRTNPLWERHSQDKLPNQVNDPYIAINKSNIGEIFNQIVSLDSSLIEKVQAGKDLLKQISPFTGRKNMEDVTPLTLFGSYYPAFRLQDALGLNSLGFSDQSMANAFQIWSSLFTKRIFPIYGGVEGYRYLDWKVDQVTGEGIDERWENYKAQERLHDAEERTEEEIYELQKSRSLRPGIEHWEAMPEVHVPGVGPIGLGDALNSITAPFFGSAPLRSEDLMTYEETMEDLFYGTEEFRKSRWWFAGSKSAYRGDRITEFAPNKFRRAHSDYEWTNTSATGEEYWGNHILPTFENPLGGLAFLFGIRDPYWYERKHYYDRPYLLTGELFNPNTLVLGDIGNATIGRLIKPVKEMHPEYWKDPILIYDEETSELGERPTEPVRTQISPGGRAEHDVLASAVDYGGEAISEVLIVEEESSVMQSQTSENKNGPKYIVSFELNEEGETSGSYVATDLEASQSIYVPSNVAKEYTLGEAFQYAQEIPPPGSEVKAVTISTNNPSYQAQVSTQPRAMMDEEFSYKQEIMYRKMANIQDPRDGSWKLQEGFENWTEPLGVYKWIIGDELIGHDSYSGEMVVQRADASYNTSNRFWESELGSLGSQMSEIGRRFVRRDDGQLDFYNPVRNTMPDWLPGESYFINFQTGDPYQKIPHGERRLPGEAYESLHDLHPDGTGRYGSFDKFKILADVAPWSDEYQFWSQYVMDNLEDPDLRKEAAEIRRQVAKRKQKFEFNPYRFKGNDVIYEEVTVDRFLDDYTFLTKEFGNQPIRVAGMEYRKKAEGVLEQYFQEGDTVTIGIAADETQRISKDSYSTMRAVIFNELGNINQQIIDKAEMVENMNDFTAPGVVARFTPKEIRQGERWETFAHYSSPLHTKFLQVRTAVEEYERDQIYGKDWSTWENFLLSDYIIPTIQGLGRFDSPLSSSAAGAVTGGVLGRFFLKGGRPTKIATIFGALYGLGSHVFFEKHKENQGEAWIPKRRRIEHDINEYFDILKYLKYAGLYQKAREEIIHETGYDVEEFVALVDQQKEFTREKRKELEEEKQYLYTNQPKDWEERRKEINRELETISEDWNSMYFPDLFLQALHYKEERDTTLYGVDPYDDRMKLMQVFPYKDKWFFNEFAEANQKDRERILELVPENQRRIYKALWGMGLEEKPPLEYYMQKYNIPDWTWEGWQPEYDLDDIKVKVVQEENLDLSDFNFWEDDIEASQYTPSIPGDYEGKAASSFEGYNALRQNIINILQGRGLYDVKVTVSPSNASESQINILYKEDRKKEIEDHLRKYGSEYM